MRLSSIFLLLAALIAIAFVSSPAYAWSFEVVGTSWGASSSPEDPVPGSHVHLVVQVRFGGRGQARNLMAKLYLEPPLYNATGGSEAVGYWSQPLSPGSIAELQFLLWLPSDVEHGSYPATIHLEWGSASGIVSEDLPIEIAVKGYPKLEFHISGSLQAGTSSRLLLHILNTGDAPAESVRVMASGDVLSSTVDESIGRIEAGSSYNITLECLPQWSQKPYLTQLHLAAEYVDGYGRLRSVEEIVPVEVEPRLSTVLVSAIPQTLNSTSTSTVEIEVKNMGVEDLEGVVLTLSPGQNAWPLTRDYVIGRLAPGGMATVSIPVYVGSQSAATLQYNLEYSSPSGVSTSSGVISFHAVSKVSSPRILVNASTDMLKVGEENDIGLIVSTPEGASSVELIVQPQSGQVAVLGSNYYWLGDLKAGDARTVGLKIYVPSGSSKVTALQVKVYYTSPEGERSYDSRLLYFVDVGSVKLELVDYSVVPSHPQPGQPFSITGTVINKGSSGASFVFVTPQISNLPFSIVSRLSGYVGSAPVGTPVSFTIPLMVDPEAKPGPYMMALKSSYVDEVRRSGETSFQVKVLISGQEKMTTPRAEAHMAGTELLLPALTITIVIAAAAGYAVGRRRR